MIMIRKLLPPCLCYPVVSRVYLLRALLQSHCGSPTLRTRQLMIDLQAL